MHETDMKGCTGCAISCVRCVAESANSALFAKCGCGHHSDRVASRGRGARVPNGAHNLLPQQTQVLGRDKRHHTARQSKGSKSHSHSEAHLGITKSRNDLHTRQNLISLRFLVLYSTGHRGARRLLRHFYAFGGEGALSVEQLALETASDLVDVQKAGCCVCVRERECAYM